MITDSNVVLFTLPLFLHERCQHGFTHANKANIFSYCGEPASDCVSLAENENLKATAAVAERSPFFSCQMRGFERPHVCCIKVQRPDLNAAVLYNISVFLTSRLRWVPADVL